jgi:hypothetical protein
MSSQSRISAIREEAVRILQGNGGAPMHVSKIAEAALAALDLTGKFPTKLVNNGLHRDPEKRFERVGRGTWRLRRPPNQPPVQ